MVAAATKVNNGTLPKAAASNHKTLEDVSKIAQNYVAGPVSAVSAITGAVSFYSANYGSGQNETVDKTAFLTARGAILLNAIFGAYDNFCSRNTPGTVGYISDFIVTLIANEENMYTLRGIGSALDQIPGFLEVLDDNHPETKKKYKNFSKYKSFGDCTEKTVYGIKTVSSDIVKDFKTSWKKDGFFKAIVAPFNNTQKNLLISSAGILTGVGLSFVPKLHKFGAEFRDVFGLYADTAVIQKGFTKDKDTGKLKNSWWAYGLGGALYIVGSVLDFIYRWTEKLNLNLCAIGMDRFGAFFMAVGNAMDNRDVRNGGIQTGQKQGQKQKAKDREPQTSMAV